MIISRKNIQPEGTKVLRKELRTVGAYTTLSVMVALCISAVWRFDPLFAVYLGVSFATFVYGVTRGLAGWHEKILLEGLHTHKVCDMLTGLLCLGAVFAFASIFVSTPPPIGFAYTLWVAWIVCVTLLSVWGQYVEPCRPYVRNHSRIYTSLRAYWRPWFAPYVEVAPKEVEIKMETPKDFPLSLTVTAFSNIDYRSYADGDVFCADEVCSERRKVLLQTLSDFAERCQIASDYVFGLLLNILEEQGFSNVSVTGNMQHWKRVVEEEERLAGQEKWRQKRKEVPRRK